MVIRRLNKEPTDEELIKHMEKDSLHRNDDINDFMRFLFEIEGNYSIFIDGKWGSGKTFFVKQTIMALGR